MPQRIAESEDLLAENGNRLHMVMMRMVFLYSVFYSLYNYFQGQFDQLVFLVIPMPSVLVCHFLYRRGRYVLSKVLLILITMGIVINICRIESQETFILAFFGPIIVGSLVTLQGPSRTVGYGMAIISCLCLIYLLITDYGPHLPESYPRHALQIERIMNLVGASILIASQLFFILHNSKKVQEQLILRSRDLHSSNEELRQTIATRDKLLSVLSHDLRSPLVVLGSGLDILADSSKSAAIRDPLAEQLKMRTRQTLSLVDDMILWSRNQAHTIEFRPSILPIAFVRTSVNGLFALLDQRKTIRLENRIPETGQLHADRNLLDAVLRNLLSNAFKFTTAGGTVSVVALEENGQWLFTVSDTGKGMSAEDVEKIRQGISFTTSGSDKEKGHGLGLQLVQDFLKMHGSTLEVESKEGQGSVFRFRIPSA